jgi:Uma2 family endonuclease
MSTQVRFTLDEYDRLLDAAVLAPDRRIELIFGELHEMSPIGDAHQDAVDALVNDWVMVQSTAELRARMTVRVQSPIRLPGQQSSPYPDMSWIAKRSSTDAEPGSDDVFLVIEVADTSLDYDRGVKAELYADASVPDYWVVNLVDDCVEVYRDPKGGRYQSLTTHHAGEEIRPLLIPDCPLRVGLIFA